MICLRRGRKPYRGTGGDCGSGSISGWSTPKSHDWSNTGLAPEAIPTDARNLWHPTSDRGISIA
jgi:hypothetical protein